MPKDIILRHFGKEQCAYRISDDSTEEKPMASTLRNIEAERNTVRRVCLRHFQTVQHRCAVIHAGAKRNAGGASRPAPSETEFMEQIVQA